jgi:hypothetical protein
MTATRRLVAILAADIARLVGFDEGILVRLRELRRELIDPQIEAHHGRIVKTTADGILIEFASVVDAVRCAITVQGGLALRNAGAAHHLSSRWPCQTLAQMRSADRVRKCLLFGVDRTYRRQVLNDANDPMQTCVWDGRLAARCSASSHEFYEALAGIRTGIV